MSEEKANLGLASTRELLAELTTRIEVDGKLDYRTVGDLAPGVATTEASEKRELPEGKRVVRTKSSGDRVYYLDEEKKTRRWITNPEVLKSLGFEIEDVVEIDDNTLLKYQMSSAIYRVDA